MSDAPRDLILEMLRAIRADIAEVRTDLAEAKEPLGLLAASDASLSRRVDRLGGDVELTRRRLNLVEVSDA
ncbi:hypothetical protein EXY23_14260 [Roseicella aquatilis]|uniref:Uncharacterized protein n=2 Tax=Roseicella aquatilis TaxID=2527868 RepID=A0A4R4DJU0_9PROT|nr:hypothetical protein EXY23_14260 [Roseicella aquatilis]